MAGLARPDATAVRYFLVDRISQWEVNKSIRGVNCYPSVARVPQRVDLALIATPPQTVPDLIEQCGYWRRKEELEDAEAAAGEWLTEG